MSTYSAGGGARTDPHPNLRLAALTAVILGVLLLAAAAFVLSYAGIHQIALRAGVSPKLARLYPGIFDAMLVIAGAAALALRSAGWWARAYAWFSLLLLFAAVATGDAFHATRVALPIQPTRATVAVTPWVLLLLAFGLWLEMLRHFRKVRAGVAQDQAAAQGAAPNGGAGPAGSVAAGTGTAAGWASTGVNVLPRPREGLDTLLGPREGSPPAMATSGEAAASGHDAGAATEEYQGQRTMDSGHYPDPVSYGEETGYVHPESYQGDYPGSYPGQSSYPGPGTYPGQGGYPGSGDYPGQGGYPGQPDYTRHGDYPPPGGYPERFPAAERFGRTEPVPPAATAAQPAAPAGPDTDPGTQGGPSMVSWFDTAPDTGPDAEQRHSGEPPPLAESSTPDSPPAAQPPAAQPTVTQPTATEPAAAEPAATESSATEPAADAQPAEQPTAEATPAAASDAAQAGEQEPPAADEAAQESAAAPWLKRLRSTPARPEDES